VIVGQGDTKNMVKKSHVYDSDCLRKLSIFTFENFIMKSSGGGGHDSEDLPEEYLGQINRLQTRCFTDLAGG